MFFKRLLKQRLKRPAESKIETTKINKGSNKDVNVDGWFYQAPNLTPNKNGNRVLISQACFGPLETWEWGIDSDNKFYVDYKWLENDFYADDSFREERTLEEVIAHMEGVSKNFANKGYNDWAELYDNLARDLPGIIEEIKHDKS